jgi:hypothetical protein
LSVRSVGGIAFPKDLEIFSQLIVKNPCAAIRSGAFSSAAHSIAGQ